MAGGGINGPAVGIAAVGAFLMWTGIRNVPVTQGLREISKGRVPTEGPQAVTGLGSAPGLSGGSASGAAIVAAARKHIGKPYVWGASGPDTFDCSGLVTYALRDVGLNIRRMYTGDFMVWSGATTIPRSQMQPGDLLCWGGHIGIASSATTMIEAPNRRNPVREGNIWRTPAPVVRRVKAVAAVPDAGSRPGVQRSPVTGRRGGGGSF